VAWRSVGVRNWRLGSVVRLSDSSRWDLRLNIGDNKSGSVELLLGVDVEPSSAIVSGIVRIALSMWFVDHYCW
jgi:hypothetical protein